MSYRKRVSIAQLVALGFICGRLGRVPCFGGCALIVVAVECGGEMVGLNNELSGVGGHCNVGCPLTTKDYCCLLTLVRVPGTVGACLRLLSKQQVQLLKQLSMDIL